MYVYLHVPANKRIIQTNAHIYTGYQPDTFTQIGSGHTVNKNAPSKSIRIHFGYFSSAAVCTTDIDIHYTLHTGCKGMYPTGLFLLSKKKSFQDHQIQVNLCQKLLFLHQLTHNMTTDCALNYRFNT